jgi:hypothetical protein
MSSLLKILLIHLYSDFCFGPNGIEVAHPYIGISEITLRRDQENELDLFLFNTTEEIVLTTLSRPGVPVGGKTVGQIHPTSDLVFQRTKKAMEVAVELLTTHTPDAPAVDERGEFIGFVSEFDHLRVLEANKDLNQLTAVMSWPRTVSRSRPIPASTKR